VTGDAVARELGGLTPCRSPVSGFYFGRNVCVEFQISIFKTEGCQP